MRTSTAIIIAWSCIIIVALIMAATGISGTTIAGSDSADQQGAAPVTADMDSAVVETREGTVRLLGSEAAVLAVAQMLSRAPSP